MIIKSRFFELIPSADKEKMIWYDRLENQEANWCFGLGCAMWSRESMILACACMLVMAIRTKKLKCFMSTPRALEKGNQLDRDTAEFLRKNCFPTWDFTGVEWFTACYLFMMSGFINAIQIWSIAPKKWW